MVGGNAMNDDQPLTPEQLAIAVDVVARAELIAAVQYGLSVGDISHESCPEIGVFDWERVEKRILSILEEMASDDDTRLGAYDKLVLRAEMAATEWGVG
jgi:hypothetical protein